MGGDVEQRDFIVLGKAHIRIAYPARVRRTPRPPRRLGLRRAALAAAPRVGAEVEEEGEDDDEPLEAVDAVGAELHITA